MRTTGRASSPIVRTRLALALATASSLALAAAASAQQTAPPNAPIATTPTPALPAGTSDTTPAPLPGAPPRAAQANTTDEVVVTGTRIRGIAPVGSDTIPVSRATIAQQGAADTNDILRDIPQVNNIGASDNLVGGNTVQNSNINNTYSDSINLRGLGTTATLTLIDGHRVAPGGPNAAFTDVNTVPALALDRVEVVADGASAIYGSDAVAGVVNLRIRNPFDGAEVAAGAGFSDGTSTDKFSGLFGKTWSGGGILMAVEHSQQTQLFASDRPNLYNDNLTAYGGAPQGTVAFPGNVSIGGTLYAIPSGQNGQNFTLSQLGAANAPNRQSAFDGVGILPTEVRNTILFKYDQDLTSSIRFFGDAFYTQRNFAIDGAAAASSGGGYTVPATNPYSPCAAGKSQANTVGAACPANGSVSVLYSFLGDLGPTYRIGDSRVTNFTDGLEFKLPGDWHLTGTGNYSFDDEYAHSLAINSNAVNTLLTAPGATITANVPGTGPVTVTHPTNLPSLNLFCSVEPCNTAADLAYISGVSITESEFKREDATLNADGPLFSLPAGKVRLAVGVEYIHDQLYDLTYGTSNTATVSSPGISTPTDEDRFTEAAYGELYVPLVGAANALPLVKRLDLSIAGRYDHYSDFGDTANPKVGVNWVPIDGLTLHASYGTSFRAPTLSDINPLSTAVRFVDSATGAQLVGSSNTSAATNYSALVTVGGHAGLKPETATTYSTGFDYKPPYLRNLDISVNYYNIDYHNRIDTPAYNAGFPTVLNASPVYDQYVVYNPTYYPGRSTVTQAQYNALVAAQLSTTNPGLAGAPPNPASVVALVDGTRQNSGTLMTNGFDFGANYHWDTPYGVWQVGGTATYVLDYRYSQTPGGTTYDFDNVFSTIGSPLRFRSRAQVGWSQGPFIATVFVNYENSYEYPNGVNFPINLLPAGVAEGTHGNISAYTTVDLAGSFDTKTLPLPNLVRGVVLHVNVINLFDKSPPFVLNNTIQYDPTEASQIGRTVSLQLTKRF